jgi:DNA-binding HxlR family transcriptional regulator
MSSFGADDVFLADCPGRLAVELIADKWTVVVLYGLSNGPLPPRVEYELTPLGATLIDPIHMLTEWARTNGDAVLDALDGGTSAKPGSPQQN